MANDGASSMSNLTAITPGAGPSPRPVGLPVHDTRSGTVITAEIPAVKAGPSYGVLLPDGSVWYPGSRKRLPAPLVLRVVVWVLAFIVLFAAAGDLVIHYRPSWVAPLRHSVPAAALGSAPTTTAAAKTTSHTSGGHSPSGLTLMEPQPTEVNSIPTTGYWIGSGVFIVTVTASSRAWVSGSPYTSGQLPNGSRQTTLQGNGDSFQIPGNGPTIVEIGAGGTTISLTRGSKKMNVPTPKHCPCLLVFDPTH